MNNPVLSRAILGMMGGNPAPKIETKVARRPRRRLWEVDKHLHCPIVGTCLSLADLERAIRRAGVNWTRRPSDIDIHHVGVKKAGEDCRLARNLGKLLDKRYGRYLSRFAEYSTEQQLRAAWQEALDNGDVPGALWALVTHPAATDDLLEQVHGDVHMLSHLNGASHRNELSRLTALEKECAGLRDSVRRGGRRHQAAIDERDARIRDLESQVVKLRIRVLDDPGSRYLADELDRLRGRLDRTTLRAERAEQRLAEREQSLDEYSRDRAALRELLDETRAELALVERRLIPLLESGEAEASPVPPLDGRKVLYVGGRASLTPHMRRLVERADGRFSHHDGGVEDSRCVLEDLVSGADLVFCPVDCVSHDACLRAKQACRRNGACFLPLRSAGLSSFAAALGRLPSNFGEAPRVESAGLPPG